MFLDQVDSSAGDCREKPQVMRETLARIIDPLYRIIKPGAFVFIFTLPRLVRRMLRAENAGFRSANHMFDDLDAEPNIMLAPIRTLISNLQCEKKY